MAAVEPLVTGRREGGLMRSKWARILMPLGVGVYFLAVWYFGWDKVRAALLSADVGLVAAAGAVSVAANCARILKWRLALGAEAHAVGLFFLSRATGVWSPGEWASFCRCCGGVIDRRVWAGGYCSTGCWRLWRRWRWASSGSVSRRS